MAQRGLPCDMELIIVDDGSKDGTTDWVKRRFPGVKVVTGGGLGPAGARNKGAQLASGEILMFLDSDDILHKDHALSLYEVLKEPGVRAAYGVTKTIDLETGNTFLIPRKVHSTALFTGNISRTLAMWCFFVPSSFAIKREFFYSLGGFPETEMGEDWLFFLTCSSMGEFGAVPRVITTRRLNPTSICKRMVSKERILALVDGLERIMADNDLLDVELEKFFAKRRKFIEREGENWKSVQDWYLAMLENGLIPDGL